MFLGDGTGAFVLASTYTSGYGLVETGDFNGDGNADIISAENTGLKLYLGNGSGTLDAGVLIKAGSQSGSSVEVVDFNDDGNLDFILQDRQGAEGSETTVFLGDGAGGFDQSQQFNDMFLGHDIAVLKVNNDDFYDFVALGNSTGEQLALGLGQSQDVDARGDLKLTTQEGAQKLLGILDFSLNELVERRSGIEAQQNRLESAMQANLISVESLQAAKSQILDADIAQSTAELARGQILQQASTSVLGQANVSIQMVLSLLDI